SFVDTAGIIVGVPLIDAHVTGEVYVGGLVGHNHDGSLSNCHSTGNVAGHTHVGGLVGESGGIVSNTYSTGNVTGYEDVGGMVGRNYQGTVSNSLWDIQRGHD
ncbi:MAG: hypothetical protein KAW00_03610, partial [Dehalococcoidia bacterium]|nr:hypothetical protein [Dehalococcoidia bacterium]